MKIVILRKSIPLIALDAAAHQAATSPRNSLPMPTQAQKEAGNYRKGRINVFGIPIAIENPKGSARSGIDDDGNEWESIMRDHYGYAIGTSGADDDPVDVFINPQPEDSGMVFVINQKNPNTGDFDEHKVMIGYANEEEAEAAYQRNYHTGWDGIQSIVPMTIDEFKDWLADGDTTGPANANPCDESEYSDRPKRIVIVSTEMYKAYIQAHQRRLKNGKVVQVQAHSTKTMRKDALAVKVDKPHGLKDKHTEEWTRLHQEQHVLHHKDKVEHEARVKQHSDAVTHHTAKAEYHVAETAKAHESGDNKAFSEHAKAAAKHKNKAQKAKNDLARHEKHLKEINDKLEGIKVRKEKLLAGSGDVGEKDAPKPDKKDPEQELRDLWTKQGVSKERQDELLSVIADKAKPGAKVGPFTIMQDAPNNPKKITPTGKENEVKTAKGTKVNTKFAVVEADKLTASHDASGNANKDYPAELQPRNRERVTSQNQVARMSKNLDPDMLGRSRNASSGAPIVGDDGVVESGNGRTMAITQAYTSGHADDYREWLEDIADTYGIDPKAVKGMKNPVLVRVRTTDVDRAQFAREANQSDMLAMTATEKAKSDAAHLTDAVLGKLSPDGDLTAASNRGFISAFMGKLGDDESAGLTTTSGQPTKQAYDRAQAAIFAKAYNDDRLLELMADTDKPEVGNIIKSLNQAAPAFIRARAISEDKAHSVTSNLTEAVNVSLDKKAIDAIVKATEMLKRSKDSGIHIEELVKQGDIFGDVDPVVAQMALFIKDNNRSAARMGEAFTAMADFLVKELWHQKNSSLFDDEKPIGMGDVIKAANDHLQKQYGEKAQVIGSRTGGFIDMFTETRGQKADREKFLASQAPAEPVTMREAGESAGFRIPESPKGEIAESSTKSKRQEALEQSLAKKQAELDKKFSNHFDFAASTNGQPLNDKGKKGQAALNKMDKQNDAIRNQLAEVEKTKQAIEREEYKHKSSQDALKGMPEIVRSMADSGELKQWRKFPNHFFVDGVNKGRIIVKDGVVSHKYLSEVPKEQYPKFRDAFNKIKRALEAGKSAPLKN